MPWRLIFFLLMLIMITLFTGFNLENTCDISFVFYTFRAVPVYVSILFSFVAGAFVVFPFFLFSRKKSKKIASGKQTIISQKDSYARDSSQHTASSHHKKSKRAPYDPKYSGNE